MGYQEFKPNQKLDRLVDCYWISEEQTSRTSRVLPDGCADLIFNFGEAIINASDMHVSVAKESIAAVGMMTTFRDVFAPSGASLLGIRFKSGRLSTLSSTPLSELKNITIQASEVIPEFNDLFLEKLFYTDGIKNRITQIEKILYRLLVNNQKPDDLLITSVTDLILQSNGQVRAEEVAEAACISLRQLQRRFKDKVGMTLKEFTKVIRFINTSDIIKSSSRKSILEIAFEAGYYDHSHLTHDFKQLAGILPSALK